MAQLKCPVPCNDMELVAVDQCAVDVQQDRVNGHACDPM